MANEVKYRKM